MKKTKNACHLINKTVIVHCSEHKEQHYKLVVKNATVGDIEVFT